MNEETKSMPDDPGTAEILYRLFIGEKNTPYYLFVFERIKAQTRGNYVPIWHWPAFIFGGTWYLYRKMYGYFALFCALLFGAKIMDSIDMPALAFLFFVIPWGIFTIGANHLYYRHAEKIIKSSMMEITDDKKRLEYIQYRGGVHQWVIWGSVVTIALLTVIAIAVPLIDKSITKKSRTSSFIKPAPGDPQQTTSFDMLDEIRKINSGNLSQGKAPGDK
jgi:hypothetical protein